MVVAALWIPVCWFVGSMLVMGTDSCSPSRSSGAFKCTQLGSGMIVALPVGLAVLAIVLGSLATRRRTFGPLLGALAMVLPVPGLIAAFQIAAQDALTPPPRSVVERAEREMAGRPGFADQDEQYLAMLTEVRAAVAEQVPAMDWPDAEPVREGCSTGEPPLDTIDGAVYADYRLYGAGPIPDAAWPAVRAAVLKIAQRNGFTRIANDFARPGIHNVQVKGPYDAELEVGHQEGTVISLRGGTFRSRPGSAC